MSTQAVIIAGINAHKRPRDEYRYFCAMPRSKNRRAVGHDPFMSRDAAATNSLLSCSRLADALITSGVVCSLECPALSKVTEQYPVVAWYRLCVGAVIVSSGSELAGRFSHLSHNRVYHANQTLICNRHDLRSYRMIAQTDARNRDRAIRNRDIISRIRYD